MMRNNRIELFTERVLAGSRTYFFDLKESQDGEIYLVISESRRVGSGYEHDRIMVFEENLAAFYDGIASAMNFLGLER